MRLGSGTSPEMQARWTLRIHYDCLCRRGWLGAADPLCGACERVEFRISLLSWPTRTDRNDDNLNLQQIVRKSNMPMYSTWIKNFEYFPFRDAEARGVRQTGSSVLQVSLCRCT